MLPPQAVLSDDGVGIWMGEPDPPEEPLSLEASVPPHHVRLGSLRPHTPYHLRVACSSAQGLSPWTHWLPVVTPQGGKIRPEVGIIPLTALHMAYTRATPGVSSAPHVTL